MDIKEIALKAGLANFDNYQDDGKTLMVAEFDVTDQVIRTVESAVAELAKQNEPVMVIFQHEDTGRTTSIEPQIASDFGRINKRWINCGHDHGNAVFSMYKDIPNTASGNSVSTNEQLTARVRELEEENAMLKATLTQFLDQEGNPPEDTGEWRIDAEGSMLRGLVGKRYY